MDLSGKETAVIQSKLMFQKDFTLALRWLETKGFKMSRTAYYNNLKKLNDAGAERLFEIGKHMANSLRSIPAASTTTP